MKKYYYKNGEEIKKDHIVFYSEGDPYADSICKIEEYEGALVVRPYIITRQNNDWQYYYKEYDEPIYSSPELKYHQKGEREDIITDIIKIGTYPQDNHMLTIEYASKISNMNNFKEKYVDLQSKVFYMVYYDINDFILGHRDKQFDWSDLSFKTFDVPSRKHYKFGPKVKWGIPEMDKWYNKDREMVKTLEFIIDDSEDGFNFWEGIIVNDQRIMGICEEEKVEIADYMEKQLKL